MSDYTPPICWHFAAETLRDGSPLPAAGVTLPRIDVIEPCDRGYHGSERALDALSYAPGPYVARVRMLGPQLSHGDPPEDPPDKVVAQQRETLTAYADAGDTLREFARACALDVIDLWDAPSIVRQYLETGHESLRTAAWVAAWAVGDAAGIAAWVAWVAARDAARDAAWAAGVAAAAATGAARGAAREAAWDAAWAAARDAAWAARDAAGDAENARLTGMLERLVS